MRVRVGYRMLNVEGNPVQYLEPCEVSGLAEIEALVWRANWAENQPNKWGVVRPKSEWFWEPCDEWSVSSWGKLA